MTFGSSNVASFYLCVEKRNNAGHSSEEFAVSDFAFGDEALFYLTPWNLDVVDMEDRLCAQVVNPKQNTTYFPIYRMDRWESQPYKYMDDKTTSLIYFIGALHLIVAVAALSTTIVFGYLATIMQLRSILLGFIFLFNLVRSIYFFILPSGAFNEHPSVDYALVEVPTFLYFTAFTVLLMLWATFFMQKMVRSFGKNFMMAFLGINLLIYSIFLTIMLVYTYLPSQPIEFCAGRLGVVHSDTTRRVLSGIYHAFMAMLSLLLGAGLLLYGTKLYSALRSSKAHIKQDRDTLLLQMALVGSLAFILHSAFFLILNFASFSNVIFSVIGLILTEIIPCLYITLLVLFKVKQMGTSKSKTVSSTNIQMSSSHSTPNSTSPQNSNSTPDE